VERVRRGLTPFRFRERSRHPRAAAANPLHTVKAWWQAAPFALVFLLFFLIPLALVAMVSLWNFNEYELIPASRCATT
jgi:ABC-type sugar transport system permease subunit